MAQLRSWMVCVLLVPLTLLVYAPLANSDFVNYDDPFYVSRNLHMRDGLTAANVKWAFTSGEGANWYPLTRLSQLLDAELFGLRAGAHHLVNLAIHILSALALYAFLRRARIGAWCCAFVAALFALHPLHVESVAWISERKDLLCALFGFLALWAWVRYSERPSAGRYLAALGLYCLGLMSKPMLVTLPVLLLLLDIWPLGRFASLPWTRLAVEKAPFAALAAAASVVTYMVQQAGGAVRDVAAFPLALRLGNAIVSYAVYLARTFWPAHLAFFYPYPATIPAWQTVAAGAVLAGISIAVARLYPRFPYLAIGWLWFVVTLLPVIGVVQVGAQARADRYMYLPMIGLGLILGCAAEDAWRARPGLRRPIAVASLAGLALCAGATSVQVGYWRDDEALYRHALDVTEGNYLAHHNLGTALLERPGHLAEAIAHFETALRITPDSASVETDLGRALMQVPGRSAEGLDALRAAVRIDPGTPIPHNNLCAALARMTDRLTEAIAECEAALRLDPDYAEAHNNLGAALAGAGRMSEAVPHFQAALRLRPDYAEARENLARTAPPPSAPAAAGMSAEDHNNLGVELAQRPGRLPEAIQHFEQALRMNPDYADAHYNLGLALSDQPGRLPEAIRHLETALKLRPDPELDKALRKLRESGR